ncbi:MAG: diadenylate cyclase CdaA [Oscillospiraceae bacterium]
MSYITMWFNSLASVLKTSNIIIDLLDILILSYLVYKLIKFVKETRAEQLIKGILILLGAYFVVELIGLKTMSFFFKIFFEWGILAVIVMFQPELRRVLEKMGHSKVNFISGLQSKSELSSNVPVWKHCIDAVVNAAASLSSTKTGALIVIEKQTKLGEQIDTGTQLDSVTSTELLENIFYPNTTLHDGAVIIRDGKIKAASCFLPKPQKEQFVDKKLGSRHRAAIGVTEISDCLVVVVSEETGTVSLAENGKLIRGLDSNTLRNLLEQKILPSESDEESKNLFDFFKKKKSSEETTNEQGLK